MKILFYHPWIYLKGGAEKVLLEYALRTHHEVTIATSYYDKDNTFKEFENINIVIINGITNVSVQRSFINILKSFISICTLNVQNNYDIVIISSEGLGDFFGSLNPFFNTKKVAYVHTPLKIIYDPKLSKAIKNDLSKKNWYIYNILKPIYKFLNKIIWKKYSYIIANSNEVKSRIVNNNLYNGKIDVIHPGANISNKYKNNRTKNEKIFLVAGRIMWQKRIEVVIEAFKQLDLNNLKLVIMGTVDNKSIKYLNKIKLMISTHANIEILDNPDDETYYKIFENCYSVIFSPECEDWGIIPIEAMAKGKPIIALNQCGPKESVIHEKTGYLINKFSSKSFQEGIEYIYNLTEDEYNKFSRNCYDHSKNFSWDEFTKKLDNKIEEKKR